MKKTNPFWLPFLLLTLFFWQSCSPFTKVYSEEEPGANLYKYHTYNWLDNPETKLGNSGPDWLTAWTQANIRTSVEEQLGRYGFKPCDEKPDLMLHYHVVIKNEVLYIHDWQCDNRSIESFEKCNRVKPQQYREGTLLQMVGQGSSEGARRKCGASQLRHHRP